MNLPNIWSRGQLFCFSALDGINMKSECMCGQLLAEKIGISFDSEGVELYLRYKGVRTIEHKIVASDILSGQLNGKVYHILFVSQNSVVGICSRDVAEPFCHADFFVEEKCENGLYFSKDGTTYCFLKENRGDSIVFALSKEASKQKAFSLSESALKLDS